MEQEKIESPKRKRGRPKSPPNAICTQCGKPFHRPPSQQRTKLLFCSHKCSGFYYGTAHINTPEMRKQRSINMMGSNNPRWVGGEIIARGKKLIRNPSHPRAWVNGYVPEKYLTDENLMPPLPDKK